MKWIIIVALALTSCAHRHIGFIDRELSPYTEHFINKASLYGYSDNIRKDLAHIDVIFGSLPVGQLGVCTSLIGNGTVRKLIVINREDWPNRSELGREQIMFHELTHCLFAVEHIDGYNNGIPVSIMNTYHINDRIYGPNRDYYIKKLFSEDIYNSIR